jgi:hypothetical protein
MQRNVGFGIFRVSDSPTTGSLSFEDLTALKIVYVAVDGKPEVLSMYLRKLVGERGFEPPTPWSRTRCSTRLSHSPTNS